MMLQNSDRPSSSWACLRHGTPKPIRHADMRIRNFATPSYMRLFISIRRNTVVSNKSLYIFFELGNMADYQSPQEFRLD